MSEAGREDGAVIDLLEPLVYADAFDCAATLEELWRYNPIPIERQELARRLEQNSLLQGIVIARDGLYALRDRPQLIDRRATRMGRAEQLRRRARPIARTIGWLPFVRAVALTGSAAADDAGADADVDLLVIVARERLGTVFLLLGGLSKLLRRRLFCPNYYLCEDRLTIASHDLYVARELAQSRGLAGDIRALYRANPWLAEIFPNASRQQEELSSYDHSHDDSSWVSRLRELVEWGLRSRYGDRVERFGRRVAFTRLGVHYGAFGESVPDDVHADFESGVSLRFHGKTSQLKTLARYERRRREVVGWLLHAQRHAAANRAPAEVCLGHALPAGVDTACGG